MRSSLIKCGEHAKRAYHFVAAHAPAGANLSHIGYFIVLAYESKYMYAKAGLICACAIIFEMIAKWNGGEKREEGK